jgi:hypothetical protein
MLFLAIGMGVIACFASTGGQGAAGLFGLASVVLFGVFLVPFLQCARAVGFPLWSLVCIAVLALVPVLGIVPIMTVDRTIHDFVRLREE